MAQSAFVYSYLPEIIGGAVFWTMADFHLFLQKTSDDGRRKIWPVELFFVVLAVVFAFFTTGFDELQKLFSRY